MTLEENIIALEQEVIETRRAAVGMMLGMLDAMTRTPEEREEIARSFDQGAAGVDPCPCPAFAARGSGNKGAGNGTSGVMPQEGRGGGASPNSRDFRSPVP